MPMILFMLIPSILFAQKWQHEGRRFPCTPRECNAAENLSLSEEQKKTIESIDSALSEQINRVRSELMSRRFELQSMLRDPEASEQKIRKKAEEIEGTQNKCLETMIDREIKIRSVLTTEQLRKWCSPLESCFTRGWGK